MPKLNELKGVAEKPKKKAAKEVLSLTVREGLIGLVAKYNAAADRLKAARADMDVVSPLLVAEGLDYVFTHNCGCREDTKKQIKSVNLVEPRSDDLLPEQTPPTVQFSWSTRTLKCDRDVVKAHFSKLMTVEGKAADPNKYAEDVVVVDFDKKVFVDAKGKFSNDRFDAFVEAVNVIAKKQGITNPLSFYKEFKATPEMNVIRFKELDPAQNLALHLVLPTSTSLEPVRSNGEE